MPALVALLATLVVTLVVVTVLGGLIAWSFGTVGRWLIDNAARFQLLYMQLTEWLEGHGILLTSLLVDNFNASWLIRAVQEIGARIHGLLSFTVITFVFTVLGLLEVDIARSNIESLRNRESAQTILQASERIADKFQKYMLVRSIMSVLTGTVVWGFALLAGLELATAWGVIAFVLNYIPFIGPFVAAAAIHRYGLTGAYGVGIIWYGFCSLTFVGRSATQARRAAFGVRNPPRRRKLGAAA